MLISIVLAIAYLCLFGVGVSHIAESSLRFMVPDLYNVLYTQVLTFGLYLGGFIVSFLAVFSAAGSISSEIETGVIQAVITKPIRRRDYILGRFFGLALFMTIFAALFFGVILLIMKLKTGLILQNTWPAMGLFALQPVVLLAVTILGSVLLPTVANGVLMFMLYMVAVIGGFIEQIGWLIYHYGLQTAGIITSLIMPTDALYRKMVHLLINPAGSTLGTMMEMGPFGSLIEPSVWMLVYTFIYIVFFIFLSTYVFTRKDIA